MDMIRWLATNKVVLTAWGLGILAMLLSWIFGGSKAPENVAAVQPAVEVVSEPSAEAVKPLAVMAAATTAAVSTASEKAEEVVEAVEEVAEVTTETAVETVTDAATGTTQAETQEVAESTETVDTESAAVENEFSGKSSDDLLMMAREAYWDNDLDKAATLYSELITREPAVFEHKGELGNLFWRQGYPKKAAELYAEIAKPMIEGGNGERVSNMVGFIGLFFPEKAASIRTLLDEQ